MTAQVPNTLEFQGNLFVVVDASNGDLFDPGQHGFTPISLSTACHRGFVCAYVIEGDRLLLQNLEISHGVRDPKASARALLPLPEFHRVSARLDYRQDADGGFQDCHGKYDGLGLALAYSGSVMISRNSNDQYEPRFMGYARAWDYDSTLMISFSDGSVGSVRDCSAQIRTFIDRYMIDDWVDPEQRRNARRYIGRQFGKGFSLYPGGA